MTSGSEYTRCTSGASPGVNGRSRRRGVSSRSTPRFYLTRAATAHERLSYLSWRAMGVLASREFRLVFFAQSISVVGDRMVGIALAFAVLELGGSATEVGIVMACRTLPLVATLLVGGVVADRVSRRVVMVVSDVARVLTQGLTALLLIAGAAQVWELAVLAGLTGAAGGFFNPAVVGVMPTIVPRERLQEANGLRATAM